MLKELFEYVVSLSKPGISEINGHMYTDKKLHILPRENTVKESLHVSTLSGLLDYIKNSADTDLFFDSYILQVVSPTLVRLVSPLDSCGERDIPIEARAPIPEFPFDGYLGSEAFLIGVRSKFRETEDRELIIKFAGSAEVKTLQKYKDDGISQKVTVSSGIASKEEALVPTIVTLKPFSTFTEVEQPEREFIFRMRDDGSDVRCALFEADGGAWEKFAMWNIKEYLEDQLKGIEQKSVRFSVMA